MTTTLQSRLPRLFHRVLLRQSESAACPEGRLMAAVIVKAFQDVLHGHRDARRFFVDGRMDHFAGLIGADADAVRDMVARARAYRPKAARLH
jgi:hypothetical protein